MTAMLSMKPATATSLDLLILSSGLIAHPRGRVQLSERPEPGVSGARYVRR